MNSVMKCNDCGSEEVQVTNLFADGSEKAMETIRACEKCGSNNISEKPQLLTIKLDDIDSVPKVFYKGEEITNKIHVAFEWNTQSETPTFDIPRIEIEHAVVDGDKAHTRCIGVNTTFKE